MKYDEEMAEAEAAAARDITAKPKPTKKTIAPRSTGFTPINRQAVPDVKKSTAADEEDDPEDEPARRPATRQSKRLLRKDDNRSESPEPTESTEGSDKNATKQPLRKRQKMTTLMRTARISQGTLTELVSAISDYHLTMEEKKYLHSLAENNDNMTEELKNDHPNFFERIFVDSDEDFDSWVKSVTNSTNTSSDPPAPAKQRQSAETRASPHKPATTLPGKRSDVNQANRAARACTCSTGAYNQDTFAPSIEVSQALAAASTDNTIGALVSIRTRDRRTRPGSPH